MKSLSLIIAFFLSLIFLTSCQPKSDNEVVETENIDTIIVEKTYLFGIDIEDFEIRRDTIQNGTTWNDFFASFAVGQAIINETVENSKEEPVSLKHIVVGKPFTIFEPKNGDSVATYIVYEPDVFSYIVFTNQGSRIDVVREYRPIEIVERTVTGIIRPKSNLSLEINRTFDSYAMTAELAGTLEGIYAWSVDFFRLQPGDKFIITYDEKRVDGVSFGIDTVKYAWFEHENHGLYAFNYRDTTYDIRGFYDEKGGEMKRPFLAAPVNYTRISSGYTMNRFHPILKVNKPHLGTDYSAPTGTPIYSTADGVVEKAEYSKGGNGTYVKIRHNQTYQTQYLHMSKIETGIKPGVRVKQGQVIGYVGQTGLATGPHVCYRFWKNGVQVDPRAEKFPDSEPMKEEAIPSYLSFITPYKSELDQKIEELKLVRWEDEVGELEDIEEELFEEDI